MSLYLLERNILNTRQRGIQRTCDRLLGRGRSSKPGRRDGIEYMIDLWVQLVEDYATQCILSSEDNSLDEDSRGVVLMGNSL